MNQHPKYGQRMNCRRDNSYKKRQWRVRKVKKNLLHICLRNSRRFWFGGFRFAGFFRDWTKNGRWCFFTYNKSQVRRLCNRTVRRYKGEITRTRPGMFRLIHYYANEIF